VASAATGSAWEVGGWGRPVQPCPASVHQPVSQVTSWGNSFSVELAHHLLMTTNLFNGTAELINQLCMCATHSSCVTADAWTCAYSM
jgi:hypothetical protein